MQNTSEVPWALIGVTDQSWTLPAVNSQSQVNEKQSRGFASTCFI